MRPAVEALAEHCRVLTFSPGRRADGGHVFDPALGFDNFIVQVDRVLTERGVSVRRSAACRTGASIAARYAALRPERVRALVLVSALAPGWTPDARVSFYLRAPWLSPACSASMRWRRSRSRDSRRRCAARRDAARASRAGQLWRVRGAPTSPAAMRDRMRLLKDRLRVRDGVDVAPDAAVTGEPRSTRRAAGPYARLHAAAPHAET